MRPFDEKMVINFYFSSSRSLKFPWDNTLPSTISIIDLETGESLKSVNETS